MTSIIRFLYSNITSLRRAFITATIFSGLSFYSAPMHAESYLVHTGPNGYPPYLFVDERADGVRYSGIIVDLLEAFEKEYPEFSHGFNSMSRTRANLHIARGEFSDLMFFSPEFASPSAMESYQFTHTLFNSKDVVVTLRGTEFKYRKPEDLYGKTVSTIRGYSYKEFDELIENGTISSVPVNLHVQAIGMLEKKRVDAYFGNMIVTPFYLKSMGLDESDFTMSEKALYEVKYAFMIHRDKHELYDALNDFIIIAKANGVFSSIVNKYLK